MNLAVFVAISLFSFRCCLVSVKCFVIELFQHWNCFGACLGSVVCQDIPDVKNETVRFSCNIISGLTGADLEAGHEFLRLTNGWSFIRAEQGRTV